MRIVITKRQKRKQLLRDIAKFISGLVVADIAVLVWMTSSGLLPVEILGVEFDRPLANLGIALDVFLLIILVHYAWHPGVLEPNLPKRALFITIGIVTAFAAGIHIIRFAMGLDFMLGGWLVPMWISWFISGVTAFVSYTSFHLLRK